MPTTTHIDIERGTRISARADQIQGIAARVHLAIGNCEAFIMFTDLDDIARFRCELDKAADMLAEDLGVERGAA